MISTRQPLRLIGIILATIAYLWLGRYVLASPTQQNQPPLPQPNGITAPTSEDIIAGVVLINGTADHPDFLRYELALYKEFDPYAGWIVFADGAQPVISGTLAVWDTTIGRASNAPAFADGLYRLRLRVVRRDYNYDEYFVTNVFVSNDTPTPTPTVTPTATIDPLATPTLLAPEVAPAVTPTPDLLPSLTPFPTPSAVPIATTSSPITSGVVIPTNGPEASDPVRDIISQTQNFDTSPLLSAFQLGARLALYSFAALAIYLIVRTVGRWIWLKLIKRKP